jgi:hypothetical protein
MRVSFNCGTKVARPLDLGKTKPAKFIVFLVKNKGDFPSFIDDDHRVWRRLKQFTKGEDFSSLHSKLRMPRQGAHISPLYWRDLVSGQLPRTLPRYCFLPKCA